MAPNEDGGRLYAGVQAAGRVMLSGGVSGVAARVCTHPFDTVKSRQQVAGSLDGGARRLARASMPTALLSVLRAEGVAGLYRGFGAVAFGVPFASAFYFGGYESSKALLGEGTAAYICAGLLGQSAAGLVYTPVDVIKERLQVQSLVGRQGYRYASALDGLRSVVRAEGVAGLMRGYWANNATWWPWNVAYFLAYEHGRDLVARHAGVADKAQLPPATSSACACAAAAAATLLTSPADLVKTRLQTAVGERRGAAAIAADLYRAEGARAFFAGAPARVLAIAPGSAISFFLYEVAKRFAAPTCTGELPQLEIMKRTRSEV
mmetsp:Transcript_5991/g.19773  ORF Transcript_5991/g.19773 Transcript_5991/m.19773 type:complete len:320 (-) Transcript_5991:172-1131(-)|eukprot:CAMPEP_0185347046 /NCGR_PEP_ID=MMETSP1364-20130426/898_1 /TAXON_ID=38817 /ORGANISM="Gephyrocapsa oceanica, Strain RCC1303" /LENGTH=319 /DNA_ID=CAMNT_0027946399 /DNA_START=149 /DNA_END=1108 /DNA_ORIENTATION=+